MQRSEVWLVNLDPTIGAEIRKTRPAVILSSDLMGVLPLRIIVPITEWKSHYEVAPWLVKLEPDSENGLEKPSAADCFQIRSVSIARLYKRLGRVSPNVLRNILQGVREVLEIEGA
ncbi:MAG: type II toxin-antitoxin system PemK/MazF family toxin [Anaerolineales bacterium]